jgi:hypothetical protein
VPATALTFDLSPNPNRVYWLGYPALFGGFDFNLAKVLFPGVPAENFAANMTQPGPHDVLLNTRMITVRPCPKHKRVYSLGPLADSKKTIRSYVGAMVLGLAGSKTQKKMFDPQFRVKNNKKNFLLYVNSHCVEYREKAFKKLSSIATVHYGGHCSGGRSGKPK